MSRFKLTYQAFELIPNHPFGIARATKKSVQNVLVRLSSNGVSGYGEAAPNAHYGENTKKVKRCFRKLPPHIFDDIHTPSQLDRKLSNLKQLNELKSARVALEMAWLDWWAQTQQQPLWKLWGFVPPITPPTSFTIGLDALNTMKQKVREATGFSVLKVKLGTGRDRQIIRAIRTTTDKPLRVDANEGWKDLDQAKKMLAFLEQQHIELVEQPMPASRRSELVELKKSTDLPLCADESFTGEESLEEMAEAFDIINIKLMKTGSLLKAREIMQKAQQAGLKVMTGCMLESSVGIAAAALLGIKADYVDLDGNLLLKNDPAHGLTYTPDHCIQLPDRPGLGVSLNQNI